MSRSYKATGINLKGMPLGETDRLLTILTIEHGLIRVVAPGARKHKSRLAGRSSQFVINELFIIQGKRLDKLVQAETVRSFPGLTTCLAKLTASQYLAELVLGQALSEQPQGDLFTLLVKNLQHLEQTEEKEVLATLSQGIFALLTLAGVEPELKRCSVSQREVVPDLTQTDWRIGFSSTSGGIVSLEHLKQHQFESLRVRSTVGRYAVSSHRESREGSRSPQSPPITLITAQELLLLQSLGRSESAPGKLPLTATADEERWLWQKIERLLRQYAEYHLDRPILSATLIDTCFPATVLPE